MCASVSVSVPLLILLAHVNLFTVASSTLNIHPLYQRLRRQSACSNVEYTCANGECIASYSVCDGSKECSDGSDETRAACTAVKIRCPIMAFECSYGACIDKELKCNGREDCADGSDEFMCGGSNSTSSCPAGNFQCSNGQCISQYSMCDGSLDCSDGSDETMSLCKDLVCPSSSFKCAYGACLDKSVECNNKQDCPDGSDEHCGTPTTTEISHTVITGGCRLPPQPLNGVYVPTRCSLGDARAVCSNIPGTPVPDKWLLEYRCNANYDLSSQNGYEFSVCDDGIWRDPLSCIKLCPALVSISVDIQCFYNGREVSCGNRMRPNTTAKANCKQHYKEIYPREYTNLVCLDNGEWNYRLFYCAPDCGISTGVGILTSLILHGTPTHQGEYPWIAGLYYKNSQAQWEQKCGGTLITPHIVLTAAHCLVSDTDGIVNAENMKVGLGKYYRDFYKQENHSLMLDAKEVVVPRFYSGRPSFYALDIGLVDLKISVQVTAYIMPACIDWLSTITVTSGTAGHVAGWGTTENGTSSDTVLSTQLTYIDNGQCIKSVRQIYKRLVTHDKFCAGVTTPNGGQVDKGDSGGGFTIVEKGQHFVFGVVSTKIVQERGLSLFTDLSNVEHHKWLEEHKTRLDRLHTES